MLRLWRDEIYAGLFGSVGLLSTGKGKQLHHALAPDGAEPTEVLAMLLDGVARSAQPGSELVVTIGGALCPVIALPWSRDVRSAEEKEAFARAHFEQAGMAVDQGHLVHVEFRHFETQGIAYAVPSAFLDVLKAVAAERQIRLVNVMPVAVAAYFAARLPRASHANLTLLVEENASNVLALDRDGLSTYDAEPAFGGPVAALRRLLLRLDVGIKPFSRVELWTPLDCVTELEDVVKEVLAQTDFQLLPLDHWRRFQ